MTLKNGLLFGAVAGLLTFGLDAVGVIDVADILSIFSAGSQEAGPAP